MNWEQALSKTSSRDGWDDGERNRTQAYSKMISVAILEVRRHRCRQRKCTNHSMIWVIVRYTKTRLNIH